MWKAKYLRSSVRGLFKGKLKEVSDGDMKFNQQQEGLESLTEEAKGRTPFSGSQDFG
jgi:hypothetical protein